MSTNPGPGADMIAKADQVSAALQARLTREVARTRSQLDGFNGDTTRTIVRVSHLLMEAIDKEPHLVASVLAAALIRLAQQGTTDPIDNAQ